MNTFLKYLPTAMKAMNPEIICIKFKFICSIPRVQDYINTCEYVYLGVPNFRAHYFVFMRKEIFALYSV